MLTQTEITEVVPHDVCMYSPYKPTSMEDKQVVHTGLGYIPVIKYTEILSVIWYTEILSLTVVHNMVHRNSKCNSTVVHNMVQKSMTVVFKFAGPEGLRNLFVELDKVVYWYRLGQALLIPEHTLEMIRLDHPSDNIMCKNAMLSWWWNNAEESEINWLTLVQALAETGSQRLAAKLAVKYGKYVHLLYGIPCHKFYSMKCRCSSTTQKTNTNMSSNH